MGPGAGHVGPPGQPTHPHSFAEPTCNAWSTLHHCTPLLLLLSTCLHASPHVHCNGTPLQRLAGCLMDPCMSCAHLCATIGSSSRRVNNFRQSLQSCCNLCKECLSHLPAICKMIVEAAQAAFIWVSMYVSGSAGATFRGIAA